MTGEYNQPGSAGVDADAVIGVAPLAKRYTAALREKSSVISAISANVASAEAAGWPAVGSPASRSDSMGDVPDPDGSARQTTPATTTKMPTIRASDRRDRSATVVYCHFFELHRLALVGVDLRVVPVEFLRRQTAFLRRVDGFEETFRRAGVEV